MTELKPCPCCGSSDVVSRFELVSTYPRYRFLIKCCNCGLHLEKICKLLDCSFEMLIEETETLTVNWNRRTNNEQDGA